MNNLACWVALQDADYFERHSCYCGLHDIGPDDAETIERFVPIKPEDVAVVIGCGYGRECAYIAPRVARLYGIDVSAKILDKATGYLATKGITNFVPVLADRYASEIPDGIDLVYSHCVVQHLSRAIVQSYLADLGRKLRGSMLIQFLESAAGEYDTERMKVYEPSVSWTPYQIEAAAGRAGLTLAELRTQKITDDCWWHWAHLKNEARSHHAGRAGP